MLPFIIIGSIKLVIDREWKNHPLFAYGMINEVLLYDKIRYTLLIHYWKFGMDIGAGTNGI